VNPVQIICDGFTFLKSDWFALTSVTQNS